MSKYLVAISAVLSAFVFNLLVIPCILKFSHRFKWYDLPDTRKIHKGLIPRLGGVGIFSSFLFSLIVTAILFFWIEKTNYLFNVKFIYIFAGLFLIHFTGLVDDFYNLRALLKLGLQIMAALLITLGGFLINSITLPYLGEIKFYYLAYPITIIWIVGIANALNLVDGMDGLAGGISGFAALSMGIIALIQFHLTGSLVSIPSAIFAFALFGSILGFLRYNFPPARIFMGDSGSLLLGFALAVIPLMGISKAASFGTLLLPVTLLTVPIIDTLAAIIRRIRRGKSIISPDKDHIHHKLLDIGMNEKKILTIIYTFCLYLSIVSITSIVMPKETNVYLILVVWIGSMMGYYLLDFLKSKKKAQINIENDSEKKQKGTTA